MTPTLEDLEEPAIAAPVRGDSFIDVKQACHRWLMRRDEHYRRKHEENVQARATKAAKKSANRQSIFSDH